MSANQSQQQRRYQKLGFVLCMILVVVGLLALAHWQYQRAQQKTEAARQRQAAQQQPALPPVPASLQPKYQGRRIQLPATAQWQHQHTMLLAHQRLHDRGGWRLFTPLVLPEHSLHVWVDRGFLPYRALDRLEPDLTPFAKVSDTAVEAVVQRFPKRRFGGATRGVHDRELFFLEPQALPQVAGTTVAPVYLRGLQAGHPQLQTAVSPRLGAERHYQYMATWLTLAGLVLLLTVAYIRKKPAT